VKKKKSKRTEKIKEDAPCAKKLEGENKEGRKQRGLCQAKLGKGG
jgi:hypothetical protein